MKICPAVKCFAGMINTTEQKHKNDKNIVLNWHFSAILWKLSLFNSRGNVKHSIFCSNMVFNYKDNNNLESNEFI